MWSRHVFYVDLKLINYSYLQWHHMFFCPFFLQLSGSNSSRICYHTFNSAESNLWKIYLLFQGGQWSSRNFHNLNLNYVSNVVYLNPMIPINIIRWNALMTCWSNIIMWTSFYCWDLCYLYGLYRKERRVSITFWKPSV